MTIIALDNDYLAMLGLDALTAVEREIVLKKIYEILELRAGVAIARLLTPAQLAEFEGAFERNEARAERSLYNAFPFYGDVVVEQYIELTKEIRSRLTVAFGEQHSHGDAR